MLLILLVGYREKYTVYKMNVGLPPGLGQYSLVYWHLNRYVSVSVSKKKKQRCACAQCVFKH